MGEAKRRQNNLGDKYGKDKQIFPWLSLTQKQLDQAYKVTTKGAWIGIGTLATIWVIIRFIGPAFGWWELSQ